MVPRWGQAWTASSTGLVLERTLRQSLEMGLHMPLTLPIAGRRRERERGRRRGRRGTSRSVTCGAEVRVCAICSRPTRAMSLSGPTTPATRSASLLSLSLARARSLSLIPSRHPLSLSLILSLSPLPSLSLSLSPSLQLCALQSLSLRSCCLSLHCPPARGRVPLCLQGSIYTFALRRRSGGGGQCCTLVHAPNTILPAYYSILAMYARADGQGLYATLAPAPETLHYCLLEYTTVE